MLRIWTLAVIATLVALAAAGCSDDGEESERLRVLGSTSIVADWVERVGGDDIEVDSLVPRDTDVHSFVVAPGDIRAIGDADVIFLVGEHLESGFQGEVDENASGHVIVLAEGLPLRQFDEGAHDHEADDGHDDHEAEGDEAHDHDDHEAEGDGAHDDHEAEGDDHGHVHGAYDPHIWMDIGLTVQAVERIRDTLAELDPENGDSYEERASDYIAELQALDEEIAATMADLPEERRYMVTFHDAYGYFADRYGLKIIGFVVENEEDQPSAAAYASLIDEIAAHDIPFIFKEPQFDARVVDQLANDTGAEVRTIPSDALNDDAPDYVALMRAIASGIAGE